MLLTHMLEIYNVYNFQPRQRDQAELPSEKKERETSPDKQRWREFLATVRAVQGKMKGVLQAEMKGRSRVVRKCPPLWYR